MRRLLPCAALLVAALLSATPSAAHSAHGPVQLDLEAHDDGTEYWFQMPGSDTRNPPLRLEAGAEVEIRFTNQGDKTHNLRIGGPVDAATVMVEPGGNTTLHFQVPADAPPTFAYWCDPHRGDNMDGEVVVLGDGDGQDAPGLPLALLVAALGGLLAARRRG